MTAPKLSKEDIAMFEKVAALTLLLQKTGDDDLSTFHRTFDPEALHRLFVHLATVTAQREKWKAAAEAFEPLVHDCEDGADGEHEDIMCQMGLRAHVLIHTARELEPKDQS